MLLSRENSGLEHAEGQVLTSDRNTAQFHFDNPGHPQSFYRTLDVSDTLEAVIHHLHTVVHLSVLCLTDKLSRCQTNFFSFHLKALCHLGLVNIESILFPFSPTIQRPCFWEHCAVIYCVLNRECDYSSILVNYDASKYMCPIDFSAIFLFLSLYRISSFFTETLWESELLSIFKSFMVS